MTDDARSSGCTHPLWAHGDVRGGRLTPLQSPAAVLDGVGCAPALSCGSGAHARRPRHKAAGDLFVDQAWMPAPALPALLASCRSNSALVRHDGGNVT
jgi:hypothetical protein